MPHDRDSLQALHNLIEQANLILETTPSLPQNRTAACRENLRAALAITEDLISQAKLKASPAAIMGSKGGATTAKRGSEYFRELAAKRQVRRGGRPIKPPK